MLKCCLPRVVGLTLATWLGSVVSAGEPPLVYPETKTVPQSDDYHGTNVADPYRWLEDDVRTSPEVAAWVEAQNKVTFGYLEQLPKRKLIADRLTKLWNYERTSVPFREGGRYYFYKNDGLQNQAVLYKQDTLESEATVLIDPNTWTEDGTIALAGASFSEDGRYVAFARSEAGSDWRTWRVMEIASGRILDDELLWTKSGSVAWTPDCRGFFYSRFPAPEEGQAFQSVNLNKKVYYHRIGTAQTEDVLVFETPDHPEWNAWPSVTEDGRYLVLTISVGTDSRYRVYVKDLTEPYGMPEALIDHFDNEFSLIGNDGTKLYFQTDLDAPKRRVVAIDLRHPEPEHYEEIVPETEHTLENVNWVGNLLVCSYLQDARTSIKIVTPEGDFVREVEFPTIGSAGGFSGKKTDIETFYSFSSFTTPPSIYRYNMITGESTLFRRSAVDFNGDGYEVTQVFFESKDGTRVPMFICHKKGLKLDGSHPTLLYGYGGFSISLSPYFSVARAFWLEMGGVYVVVNLRGGGEYGEDWHKAGTKLNKQNVFDDFIGAAEWLIANKYTSSEKLAIAGGSNGGLLVGACMTQRPELFAAALPSVGVMDMLRFHRFTAGRYWVDDYGSSDNADEFAALYKYSPYHQLMMRPSTAYPATMVTTADTDDRVVPGHSFKFAAALQKAHNGDAPVLIRIETRAGHGSGKPTSKIIEELADEYAFLAKILGMSWPE
jgi:prolyl oligopeptidase